MKTAAEQITLEDCTLHQDGEYRFAWAGNHFASRYSERLGWHCSAKISPYAYRLLNGWGRWGADCSHHSSGGRGWDDCLSEGDIHLRAGDSASLLAHINHTRRVLDLLVATGEFTKLEAGPYRSSLTRAEQQITIAEHIISLLSSEEGEAQFDRRDSEVGAVLVAA